jgi:transposase-like protein
VKTILSKIILDNLTNKGLFDQISCPHCHSDKIVKNGKYKEKQRFNCKTCGKSFNSLTNTPMSMSHKLEKWPLFIECVIKGLSLRFASKEIGVSHVTLFYWRHKLMNALKTYENISLNGYVEADNTFLAYSEKGKREIIGRKRKKTGRRFFLGESRKVFLLVAADHNEHLFIKASDSRGSYMKYINELFGGIVSPKTVLCSTVSAFYTQFAKLKGINQHFIVRRYCRTEEHNINLAHDCRLEIKAWLDNFQGVASKYINSYLSLYKCLRKSNFDKTEIGILNFIKALRYANKKDTYRSIRELKFV